MWRNSIEQSKEILEEILEGGLIYKEELSWALEDLTNAQDWISLAIEQIETQLERFDEVDFD